MRIDLQIDSADLVLRLQNGQRRRAYAVVNAINNTAKRIQDAERRRVEAVFTIRKKEFMRREAAVIKPFANVRQGRPYAEIAVGQKPRLLLSAFERGAERKPFTPSATSVAEPVVGGPARPQFSKQVTPELRMGRLRFDRTKTGRRRAGVTKTSTYLVPKVGIFQRISKEAVRVVYLFTHGKKIKPRLHFVETAEKEAQKWFGEEMERAINTGRISTLNGKIDPDQADREWRENTDQSKPRNRITGRPTQARFPGEPSEPMDFGGAEGGNGTATGYARARAAREVYQAQLAKIELDRQRGILVRADEVKVGAFNMARKARDQLIALPERVAANLAATQDPAEVQRILEEEIERICQEIADAERP
jgi:hypothetical protein